MFILVRMFIYLAFVQLYLLSFYLAFVKFEQLWSYIILSDPKGKFIIEMK